MTLSIPRIIEISCYSIVNLLPFILLALHVFENRMRFSPRVTKYLVLISVLIQMITRLYSVQTGEGSSLLITLIRIFSYAFLFISTVRVHWGKALFVLLIFSNLVNTISIGAHCLESIIITGTDHALYCWHSSLVVLLLHYIVTLPFAYLIKRTMKLMIEHNPLGNEWNYYWLIPVTFTIIWQYQLYGNALNKMDVIREPRNTAFLFIINFGAMLVYYLVIRLDNEMKKNLEFERINHNMNLEKIAYQVLHERIEDTRRTRHDLRHHILVMSDYLENGEYDAMREYLNRFEKSIPETSSYLFCNNRAINRLLVFYATQAHDHDIDFQVNLSLAEDLIVPEDDISVLLGNLIENAVEACMEQQTSDRRIIISGKSAANSLLFTIDNTYENEIKKNGKGDLISTKENGSGIGLQSAKHIVERYGGVFSVKQKNNMFYASFMLNL